MLIRIEAPHFVAGLVLECRRMDRGAEVVRAAPIVRYMMGWTEPHIRHYCVGKDWGCSVVRP